MISVLKTLPVREKLSLSVNFIQWRKQQIEEISSKVIKVWYSQMKNIFESFLPKNKCYVFVLKSNSTYSFLQRILHPWTGTLMFKCENISECNMNSDRKKDINMLQDLSMYSKYPLLDFYTTNTKNEDCLTSKQLFIKKDK